MLKNCPKCGKPATVQGFSGTRRVSCENRCYSLYGFERIDFAEAAWNTLVDAVENATGVIPERCPDRATMEFDGEFLHSCSVLSSGNKFARCAGKHCPRLGKVVET